MARPMANDSPFATLSHFAGDLGTPSESVSLRIGISPCECRAIHTGYLVNWRARIAVGTLITERPPHRTVRAQFRHTACMGLFLSTEFQRSATFSSFLRFLGFYSWVRPLPRAFFRPTTDVHRRRAQNGGQGRRLL